MKGCIPLNRKITVRGSYHFLETVLVQTLVLSLRDKEECKVKGICVVNTTENSIKHEEFQPNHHN